MQDGCRIFGNGKSSKTTNKNQHHKFPSGLGYPKPEGRDEGESYTLFRTLPAIWATPIRLLSSPHAANPRVYGAFFVLYFETIGGSGIFPFVGNYKTPHESAKDAIRGGCIIS